MGRVESEGEGRKNRRTCRRCFPTSLAELLAIFLSSQPFTPTSTQQRQAPVSSQALRAAVEASRENL